MRTRSMLAWLVLAAGSTSCLHARQTKSQEETAKPEVNTESDNKKKADAPAERAAAKPKPAAARNETLELSKTTRQMFKPEGLRKLQVALSAKSTAVDENGQLDGKTQESLRAYQLEKGLPATGLPDYETLRKLGLKPDEVFQKDTPGERNGVK